MGDSHLNTIFHSMVNSLVVLSPEGTIRSVNPATHRLLGYPESELVDRPFSRILPETSLDQIVADGRFPEGGVRSMECRYLTKEGSWVPVVLSASALRGSDGDVRGIVCVAQDLPERSGSEQEMRRLAYYDQLTTLPNRALFHDRLTHAIALAQREEHKFALFFLDLDRFKEVNDTFGHGGGDTLLRMVAERIGRRIRKSDTLARLGGDEFVLISGIQTEENAVEIARGLIDLMALPFELEGEGVEASASIGIVIYPEDGTTGGELLKHADMAMYVAKARGGGEFEFFSPELNILSYERRNLELSLRRATENEEFTLHYQPQFDLQTGRLSCVEALLRWNDPEQGDVPPRKFIPLAEQIGLIRPLGEWVLQTACSQYQTWRRQGYPPFRLAVNVSGVQFTHPEFVEVIDRVLERTGMDPLCLELEITESVLGNVSNALAALLDLKVRGIQLAIDNFGTGYSSLSYLKYFPISRLKIDHSFIRDVHRDADNAAIVKATVAMAHSLGLRVTAEGVETVGEFAFLKRIGGNEVQGFYFAPPLPPQKLGRYFRRGGDLEAVFPQEARRN